ncbi:MULTISPECIES: VanZ family protein [Crossiella]|uniref:VanZ family protein n=1 Tax=Crossiella cryophila TaxID=43355 RepID=A0A7W7CIB8_9PSEU|nr:MULTISPECIES: VanZ family protein [Crossiella]MBB4681675.1 VanZ family protein [Crossiella cryophila]MCK2243304.1 VanZ family protein [Crossiella sp. S99.2]MCK2254227.1 VanZ family protein [Crossiella sp. S99.1]
MPASGVPSAPPGTDKVIHFSLFALLAVTGMIAGFRLPFLVAGLVVWAGLSEFLQAVLPIGRTGGLPDALADLLGAAVALAVWLLVRSWRRSRDRGNVSDG